MWNFDYRAHAHFFAPAKTHAEMWRLICGVISAVGLMIMLIIAYTFVVQALVGGQILPMDALDERGQNPFSFLVAMLLFGLITASVFIVVKRLHKRPAATLFGHPRRVIRQFMGVCGALILLVMALHVLPPWGFDEPIIPNLPFGTWIAILPLTLLAVLIQTSAEEILFRGYLQQQLAARFRSPLIWMIIPSILFGLLHYSPETSGEMTWIIVIWATVFGLAMADLTARSGSLGPAMAVHFINNLSAMLIVAVPGFLDGVALYVLPFGMEDADAMRAWMPVDFALICISWLTARLAIRA